MPRGCSSWLDLAEQGVEIVPRFEIAARKCIVSARGECHAHLRAAREHRRGIALLVAHLRQCSDHAGQPALRVGRCDSAFGQIGDRGAGLDGEGSDAEVLLLGRDVLHEPDLRVLAHAISGEHAGQRMYKDAFDAERIGDEARVLSRRAAEAAQGIGGEPVQSSKNTLIYIYIKTQYFKI